MERKYTLLKQQKTVSYYISDDGYLMKEKRGVQIELGYIEDNMRLYKRLCESI